MKKTIPRPPIHWVNDRQKRRPWGSASTLSITVAPVVVKPDMFSKNASVKLLTYPLSMNGSEPKRLKTTHDSVTTM